MKTAQLVAEFPATAVVLAGDFNMVPCPNVDKLAQDAALDSPPSSWASTLGLTDVWRRKHPCTRGYTCNSTMYLVMSNIDPIYVSGPVLSRVREVTVLPRGISDHAPILLQVQTTANPANSLWRHSRYWVTDERVELQVDSAIVSFWSSDPPHENLPLAANVLRPISGSNTKVALARPASPPWDSLLQA